MIILLELQLLRWLNIWDYKGGESEKGNMTRGENMYIKETRSPEQSII
jgi:hypothetical protein